MNEAFIDILLRDYSLEETLIVVSFLTQQHNSLRF